jgi:Xaa-Pro aminopeptidase
VAEGEEPGVPTVCAAAERATVLGSVAASDRAGAIAAQLERRRRASVERWNLDNELVLIGAGERIPVPGRADLTYPFRAHSEYLYLTDRERPGGVLAFDPKEGWVDFVKPVTRDERLWEGASADDGVGVPVSELQSWLEQRKERPIACLGAPVPDVAAADELAADLRYALNHLRRQKDGIELGRMRVAERATSAGFAAIVPLIEPGRTERELQIELEAAFFRNGGDFLAFGTIVGGGPNAAALHFRPTSRPFAAGELVLIDAGAEYRGYAADITRTYPASGCFTAEQQSIYAIVQAASERATERCTAGTEWRDVHRSAALVIAEGLVALGLLRGGPESLVERGAQSVFFPHGVGHMVGLGVRDAGEVLRGREPAEDEFPRLRVDLPLEVGHVFTVEPGIYFVPALIHDAVYRERHREAVDWERAERMLDFGGIRIENNVLITNDGPEVLTADVPLVT